MIKITDTDNGIVFAVRVVPRASRSEIVGEHAGALKIRLAAPPVDGAANEELMRVLAKKLGVSLSSIDIVSGQTSKTKTVAATGVSAAAIQTLLSAKSTA